MAIGDLYLELSRVLALIRCEHTKANLPKGLEARRKVEPTYLPFRFVLFDGRMYVDRPGPGTGLTRGDEVVALDGRPIAQLLAEVEPLIPVDGDTDEVKRLEIAYSNELMGPGLDHFAPFLHPLHKMVEVRATRDGKTRVLKIPRLTYPEFLEVAGEQGRYASNFKTAVRFDRLGKEGAYLAVDTFVNYRDPVDPMAVFGKIFHTLKKEGRSKLIVDLRRTGGGSDDVPVALFRHLIAKPSRHRAELRVQTLTYDAELRAHIDTWDKSALDPDPKDFEALPRGGFRMKLDPATLIYPPAPNAFAGELMILVGPVNASGATHLLAALDLAERGLRVGEATGGAPSGATAGVIFFVALPESGISVRLPVQRTIMAGAEELPQRRGLAPDVAAPMTAADYFAGRDPALAAAKARLGLGATP
ncbi:MAG: S41 family peptidase [Myxococcota bacterium]